MKKIEDGKISYNNIEIPKELEIITNELLENNVNKRKIVMFKIFIKYACSFICGFIIILGIGVNINETLATTLSKLPIIGNIISIISINDFEKAEDKTININQPNIIDNNPKEEKSFITDVNKEIEKIVNDYKQKANESIEEYKKAFIETGGTEEEFNQKNIKVEIDYEVKCSNEDILSLVLFGYEDWLTSSYVSYYYNIDLKTGENITLESIFGDDYINIISKIIDEQINQRIKDNPNDIFFGYNENTFETSKFKSISEDQKFYINQNSNVVIVFDKYEIAPGFMGQIEFEIKTNN